MESCHRNDDNYDNHKCNVGTAENDSCWQVLCGDLFLFVFVAIKRMGQVLCGDARGCLEEGGQTWRASKQALHNDNNNNHNRNHINNNNNTNDNIDDNHHPHAQIIQTGTS